MQISINSAPYQILHILYQFKSLSGSWLEDMPNKALHVVSPSCIFCWSVSAEEIPPKGKSGDHQWNQKNTNHLLWSFKQSKILLVVCGIYSRKHTLSPDKWNHYKEHPYLCLEVELFYQRDWLVFGHF